MDEFRLGDIVEAKCDLQTGPFGPIIARGTQGIVEEVIERCAVPAGTKIRVAWEFGHSVTVESVTEGYAVWPL